MSKPRYRRILLKISGEALQEEGGVPFSEKRCRKLAEELKQLVDKGLEVAVVLGGGNLMRGASGTNGLLSRVAADQVGMMATAMNGLVMEQALTALKVPTVLRCAFPCPPIIKQLEPRKGTHYLEERKLLLLAGGTGNPFFTTDTAAALRAVELSAELFLKATKVPGVFSADPRKDPKAERFSRLSYDDLLARHLQVMDGTAVTLCRDEKLPIYVFNFFEDGALWDALTEQKRGTLIST